MKPATILIVDDDALFARTLQEQLSALGFAASHAGDGATAEKRIHAEPFSLVFLDLRLLETSGLTYLKRWKESYPNLPIIMISGQGTIPEAVQALKHGAEDFLVKPVDINILHAVVKRTLQSQALAQENLRLKQLTRVERTEFLGSSRAVQELLASVEKIAASDQPLLLEGETGTGKQILARHVHERSDRSEEPFVLINCAAITQSLFESELFGHEKGAFTGAYVRKAGKLELVGKGTLFLDEIGELPASCQAKLLTVVEERTFERVGGTRVLYFDGRIIAATNRDLDKEIAAGNFRQDLFYRLSTFRFKLPSLRSRPEDTAIYVQAALERCRRRFGRNFESPDDGILHQLASYAWPGNVRELIHHVERVALLSEGNKIPQSLWLSFPTQIHVPQMPAATNLATALDTFKKQYVQEVLSRCGGNQTQAAKRLGIGRTYLNRLLARYQDANPIG